MNEKILKHPCELGLTPECFRAYPAWARRALAYKLVHVLLPKQLTKNLPKILSMPLIAPGVQLPPGVELPPGTVVPPDVSIPPLWTPTEEPPPGVIVPPPEYPTPPDTGPAAPIFLPPFEPGPIHRPTPTVATWGTQIFSNSYWENYIDPSGLYPYMSWDGAKWVSVAGPNQTEKGWAQIFPKTGTTWAVNYRPTQARVTFSGGTGPIELLFVDTVEHALAVNFDSVSPQIFDLDFSPGYDIYMFETSNIGVNFTNIEFK